MSASQGDIQERIAAARREAESLKERIRANREQSADTSREYITRTYMVILSSTSL